jgi:YVTN family beta-propeller protein
MILDPGTHRAATFRSRHRSTLEIVLFIGLTSLVVGASAATAGESGRRPTHPRGVVVERLPIEGRPHGVSIAPNGRFCVTLIDAAAISCGRVTDREVSLGSVIRVGNTPAHVGLDPAGRMAFTADQYGNTSTFVDVATSRAVDHVNLGDEGFNVVASSARAYVTTAKGDLVVIDVASRGRVARLDVGGAANGLALDSRANRLYVSSRDAGVVSVINTSTNEVIRKIRVSVGAQRIALSPDGTTLYVASESRGAERIDLASGKVSAIPGVPPGAVGLALSPDGERLYVTNPPGGTLQIVAPEDGVLRTVTGLGRPRNVAFSMDGAVALVTNEQGSVIVIR